jgi:RNA polymerase sigma-70 factor (sigma-E family)
MPDRDGEFAAFFATAWPRLFRATWLVAGDPHHAEDALQTAFVQAYAKWGRVSSARDPEAYVRRMAINAALTRHRKSSTRRETVVAGPVDEQTPVAESDAPDDEVWQAVLGLPPRQRAIVVLRYYEDLSEAQIAEVLDCRPGTVKSQASAALGHLRSRLVPSYVPEGDTS